MPENTSKRSSKKQKYNNSGNNKLSDININKAFKLEENTYKTLKAKGKAKATLMATIALSRKTRGTVTYIVLTKKQVKETKSKAISATASVEVGNIKPKSKRKGRTEVNYNVSRMLPPRPRLDFT